MRVKIAVLALIMAVGFVGAAQATPIDPFNTRQVPVGAPFPGETSLQDMVNLTLPAWGGSVTTDQSTVAKWVPAGGIPSTAAPILRFEATSGAGSHEFGIWFGTDSASLTLVPIFFGAATPGLPGSSASLAFYGSVFEVFGSPSSCGISVNCDTFAVPTLIGYPSFGFYLKSGANTFYSADSLNGGTARMLAFEKPATTWAIAFEDGGDFDYNDLVVRVESIAPVPEPGSMLLLGSGLAALWARRRRQS